MSSNQETTNQADEWEIAYSNPKCPYVTQININTQAMQNVNRALTALLGDDMTGLNSGGIHTILSKLDRLDDDQKVQHSWVENAKPILLVVASAAVTFLVTYGFTGHF